MTQLIICWYSLFGVCMYSDTEVFMQPHVFGHPGHFECIKAERILLDSLSRQGKKEPEYIECNKVEL